MSPLRRAAAFLALAVATFMAGQQAGLFTTPGAGGGISLGSGISLPSGPTTLSEGVVGIPAQPLPLFAKSGADRAIVALTYRALTRLDVGGAPGPDLASAWSVSEDALTWSFTIDPAAAWEDGTPVSAADAQLTIGLAGELGRDGGYWEALTVEVGESDGALIIRTPRPLANLPASLGTLPLLPAHLFSGSAAREIPQLEAAAAPMGTGPFRVLGLSSSAAALQRRTDLLAGDQLALNAATSGSGTSSVETIALRFYAKAEDALSAWSSKELDALVGLDWENSTTAATSFGGRAELGSTVFNGIAINLRPGTVLRHPKLRLGLRALLAPSQITSAYGGREVAAPVSPLSWGWSEVPAPVRGSDYATKQLLAAKWKFKEGVWVDADKKPVSLEILTLSAQAFPQDAAVANQAAASWSAFGIPTVVTEVDAATLTERLATGSFDLAVLNVDVGIDPDLYPLLGSAAVLTGGNIVGIQLKELDSLLNAARQPVALEVRKKALAAVQRWCAANNYLLPIRFLARELLIAPRLTGVTPLLVQEPETHLRDVLSFRLAAE
ncbi:MAG: ABC transporter substrate-binding protein [Chloroflexi bacterium]|nr:ABC transporter substrate-binding protein [Chloroflexota bacterium]